MDDSVRKKGEADIEAGVLAVFNDQRQLIAAGRPPDWRSFTGRIRSALVDPIERIHQQSAMLAVLIVLAAGGAVGLLLAVMVKTLSSAFAQTQAATVANEVTKNSIERLQDPVEELQITADSVFGQNRAESIAITETTRAGSIGEIQGSKLVGRETGVKIRYRWQTEDDAKVCPICAPLHMRGEEHWARKFPQGPPAHPNCRCDLIIKPQGQIQPRGE